MEEAAARRIDVTLRYFVGCANWQTTHEQLRQVLDNQGMESVKITLELVETQEDAEQSQFLGSPTILLDGRDPFAPPNASSFGLTCRVYTTPDGLAGTPTMEQLEAALRDAQATS